MIKIDAAERDIIFFLLFYPAHSSSSLSQHGLQLEQRLGQRFGCVMLSATNVAMSCSSPAEMSRLEVW